MIIFSHAGRNTQRAAVLTIAMMTGVICAIAAYAVLFMAVSNAYHVRSTRRHAQARQLAEAGIVIARQNLWQNAAYCPNPAVPLQLDLDGDGTDETSISIEVTNCGAANAHEIIVRQPF